MVTRAYVLAGGLSTRMGHDKGRLMAAGIARTLRLAGLEPTIVRATVDEPFVDEDGVSVCVIGDGGGARHPLIGVAAALEDAGTGLVLVVPCDLPFLDHRTIEALLAAGGEAVAADDEREHPLFAVIAANRLAECRALACAQAPVRALVDGLARVRVAAAAVRNVNTLDVPVSSRIPGFYRLTPDARIAALRATGACLTDDAWRDGGLKLVDADVMVENVVGTFALPNAVAVNLLINGVPRLVPMVVEEPSVVAAVSNMARLARPAGGFTADGGEPVMIGQVQLMDVRDAARVMERLQAALPELADVVRATHPRLEARGGGFRGFELRRVTYDEPGQAAEQMVVLHVLLDCRDAMGANAVNTVCERLAPHIEEATGEQVGLCILSNLADRRLARASVRLAPEHLAMADLDGAEVASRIAAAWRFAWADPYRAATHNKGVTNGIDAVALATGNDWRAIEAGAHAYCCRDGQYRPMTRWVLDGHDLVGTIEVPLQFGTVGGPIKLHPTVRSNLALLDVKGAQDLAGVAAAVGLAQNLGALRALATEGIQAGHMRMHARSVAATAGAVGHEVVLVAAQLAEDKDFSVVRAIEILETLRSVKIA